MSSVHDGWMPSQRALTTYVVRRPTTPRASGQETGLDYRGLQPRAANLSGILLVTQRTVLVRALCSDILGLAAPYSPTSPEEEHVAATLAASSYGLLSPVVAGYVRAYRPTPLGRLVVQALLFECVAGYQPGEGAYVGL